MRENSSDNEVDESQMFIDEFFQREDGACALPLFIAERIRQRGTMIPINSNDNDESSNSS